MAESQKNISKNFEDLQETLDNSLKSIESLSEQFTKLQADTKCKISNFEFEQNEKIIKCESGIISSVF